MFRRRREIRLSFRWSQPNSGRYTPLPAGGAAAAPAGRCAPETKKTKDSGSGRESHISMSTPSRAAASSSPPSTDMPAFVFLLLCLLNTSVGIYSSVATTSVPVGPDPPQNVKVISLNTNYTLNWDWDPRRAESSSSVRFTTQYIGKYVLKSKKKIPNWSTACEGTSRRSCDLTALDLHYLGIYALRVRAHADGLHSTWVQLDFCPDKDAAVGPPAQVELAPAGSDLDVDIRDPQTSANTSMREHLSKMYFHIAYWERTAAAQATRTQMLSSDANLVTLPNLKPWTWYCVSVQSRSDFYNKSSSFTTARCMQTEGNTPWWLIFLCFLGSLAIFFLIMMLLLLASSCCYKTLKATLFPSNRLPAHFTEYLCESPGSERPRLLVPDSEPELLCVEVAVCAEIRLLPPRASAAPPSGQEADCRHSRQDSSSSGDSGVYSAGGSSNLQRLSSYPPSSGAKDLTFDPKQLTMTRMTPELKRRPPPTREVVLDICV